MSKEEKETWDGMINQLYVKGCRPILFYRNEMTAAQAEQFIENANQILNQKEKAEDQETFQNLMK